MSSASTYSSSPERAFRSPCEFSGSIRYQARPDVTPYLYQLASCVNCHESYSYESEDATRDWKQAWPVISDHWRSCPKKFANILQTSAIRGTLKEPSEGTDEQHKRRSWSPLPPPGHQTTSSVTMSSSHSNRSHMEVDSSLIHEPLPASPKSPLLFSRRSTPTPPSAVAVNSHLAGKSLPTSASHISCPIDGMSRFLRDRIIDTSTHPLSAEGISRSPSPPPSDIQAATIEDEHVATSLPLSGALPPALDRKRKRMVSRETSVATPASPSNGIPARESPNCDSRFQRHGPSPVLVQSSSSPSHAIFALEKEPSGIYSLDDNDNNDEGERPRKKQKKNIMDWKIRKEILKADPFLLEVEAKQVKCKVCNKWIKLDARNDFYPGLWNKHRTIIHGCPMPGIALASPEPHRRRRAQPQVLDDDIPATRSCSWNQSQALRQQSVPIPTRTVRSSSRVTRSVSRTSA